MSSLIIRPALRAHLLVALVIGLVLGAAVGLGEGIAALQVERLWGRYNELPAWAILIDSLVLVGWELGTAFFSHALLFVMRARVSLASLIALHLGLGVFGIAVGAGVWLELQSRPDAAWPALLANDLPALAIGLALGALVVFVALPALLRSARMSWARPVFVMAPLITVWAGAIGLALYSHLPGSNSAVAVLASSASPRTNVIIVTIDTLRGDSIGLAGSPVQTPTLDRIGREGAWFTTEIVQQPNTNASHTSIFTGVLPFVHGVRQHMIDRLAPDVQTLAEVLGQHGYQTAGLYSWVSLETGFSGLRGFQTYEDLAIHLTPALRDARFQNLVVTYRLLGKYLFLPGLVENQFLSDSQNAVEDSTDGKANVTTDAAIRWLDSNAGSPFFLWVHYYDPHYPYTPPPPFDKLYDPNYEGTVDGGMDTIHYIYAHNTGALAEADVNHLRSLYDGEISFTDRELGRLIDEMDRLGLSNNTLLVVTGDHGESLGTDGRWFHGSRLNYSDIHVPLLIRLPSVIPANRMVNVPVESIDIMPTILDLLQIPVPARVQGESLLPVIAGTAPGHSGAVSMLDTYKEMSWVTSQWHLIWDKSANAAQLYDYHSDPQELQDVGPLNPATTARLLQELKGRLNELGFEP